MGTAAPAGSGMVIPCRGDQASAKQRQAVADSGLDLATALHWNAARHEREAARALLELLELLPDLRGAVLLGASSREVRAHARGMTGRYRHLAHWQGNDPTRTANAELLASYRRAVKFAAMP